MSVETERGKGLRDCAVAIKIKFFFLVLLGMGGRQRDGRNGGGGKWLV